MTESKDYTFLLSPGLKTRWIAGPYSCEEKQPRYEIEISVPNHVNSQVEVKQFLLGTPEDCQWGWDIHNNSTWPAFVLIKKNGILVKDI